MITIDPIAFLSALDTIFGFVGFEAEPVSEALPSDVQAARNALRRKGWSLRTAAPLLGVHWTHLHHVLKGRRESRSLLARIDRLPTRKTTAA